MYLCHLVTFELSLAQLPAELIASAIVKATIHYLERQLSYENNLSEEEIREVISLMTDSY